MRKMYTTKRLLGSVVCAAALLVAAPALGQDIPLEGNANNDQKVEVGNTGAIDLHVKELEITKVLQLLSIQAQRNIIASKSVENAKVSADLYGVDFNMALKSILEPNGFGYVEEGNFIYVLTKEEIVERENRNRKLVNKIYRLDYLRADEAAGFVTPMLSDKGAITASGNVADGIDRGLDNLGSNGYSGPTTLVIRDYEDNVTDITAILDELDTQPVNVIIEATVLRSSLTEANKFGVDFSLFTDLTGASPLDIIDGAISGGAPTSERFGAVQSNVGDVASQTGGVKLGFVAGDAAVFVKALDSVTHTTVVATPKVTVLDRNATKILVGEKVAYLSTTVTETSETQTVEFLEVGTQLNVRPFVSSDGKIRLELRPSVSDATIRTIGSTSAPDESTVELVTNVIVDSGQTVVLGGLISDDTTVGRSQVPGLGEIPLFGAAFQGQDDDISRSEVIFLVKATVVGNDTLNALGVEGKSRVDVARVARRESLLPWSQSKLTAAHMVNARKHFDEAQSLTGEAKDKKMAEALYCVDLALHMNPSMLDALMLKEQITGQKAYIDYEDSIVKETYEAVLDDELKALGVPAKQKAEVQPLPQPQPVTEVTPGFDAFDDTTTQPQTTTPTQPQTTQPQAQAESDDAWLEKMLAETYAQENATTQPQPETTGQAQTTPTTPTTEVAEDQPTTEQTFETPAEPEAQPTPAEVTEVPTNSTEDFSIDSGATAEPTQPTSVFGFSWRSLSTAQLLQLAAQAADEAKTQTENASATTPTETE